MAALFWTLLFWIFIIIHLSGLVTELPEPELLILSRWTLIRLQQKIDWKEAITWHVLVQRDSIGCAAWKHLILSTLPQVLFDFCYHSARVGLLFRDVCSLFSAELLEPWGDSSQRRHSNLPLWCLRRIAAPVAFLGMNHTVWKSTICLDDIIEKKGMSARHCCWTSVISVEKKPAYLHWCLKSWRFHHVFHSVGGFGEGSHLCVWSVASYNLSFHTGTDSRLKVVLCIRERLTAGAASVRTASFLTDSKHHSIVLLAFGWMTEWRK